MTNDEVKSILGLFSEWCKSTNKNSIFISEIIIRQRSDLFSGSSLQKQLENLSTQLNQISEEINSCKNQIDKFPDLSG